MTAKNTKQAYNLNVKVKTVKTVHNDNGNTSLEAEVVVHMHNRKMKRVVMAKGRAIEMVKDRLTEGNNTWIRCLFEKSEDVPGGERLIAIGIPHERFKQKAA